MNTIFKAIIEIYNFITFKFPYYFFPFGEKAYADIMTRNLAQVPEYEIIYFVAYRGVLHLIGAILVVAFLHLLHRTHRALELLGLGLLETYILFQELYLHPHTLNQPLAKGLFDIFVWNLPIFYHLLSKQIPQTKKRSFKKKKIVLK